MLARWAAAALILASGPFALSAALSSSDSDVKAAFIVNILRLAHKKSGPTSGDLTLCLVAAGSVEQSLRAVENTVIRGRQLRLRNVVKAQLAGCEALFFGSSAKAEAVLAKAQQMNLLTIGNDTEFLSLSGMIALLVENRRIVVEINDSSSRGSEWVFSSHLLEVARVVSGRLR
jgi:hypothetical protein